MTQKIHVSQGKRGRWRWQLKQDGKHVCMSGVRGFGTSEEAVASAVEAFGNGVFIDADRDGDQIYAGPRDFE